jgi:hypothetical protein
MVLANSWYGTQTLEDTQIYSDSNRGFTHDLNVYLDPMAFKSERVDEADGITPEQNRHALSFEFGRRVCSRKLLADATIFLSVAQSLAVFNVDIGAKDINPSFCPVESIKR